MDISPTESAVTNSAARKNRTRSFFPNRSTTGVTALRPTVVRLAATAFAAATATALALPSGASATPSDPAATAADSSAAGSGPVASDPAASAAASAAARSAAATVDYATPEMVHAMMRDLDLSATDAADRLAADAAASETAEELRTSLGTTFGGAWIDDDQHLVVAVTDRRGADEVRAAGATPRVVAHSESTLDAIAGELDAAASDSPEAAVADVHGWHVDVVTNSVVVQAAPDGLVDAVDLVEVAAETAAGTAVDAVAEAIADAVAEGVTGSATSTATGAMESRAAAPATGGATAGVTEAAVRLEVSAEAPSTYDDVIGGHPYYPGNGRCSVGFPVLPSGFVTAGHCGGVGTSTRGHNQASQGVVQMATFPGADAGYVAVNNNWNPLPYVWGYSGNQVFVVQGSQVAAIGAATCRSGSTTGWRCGTITHRNQTVNYPQGTVTGLTRTTVCAEPGDSGGSFVAANGQAQGVTSGGSGNCSVGGVTYFQPLNPILNSYGLTLVTG